MELIDKQAVLDAISNPYQYAEVKQWLDAVPTIQQDTDCISRQAAIDAVSRGCEEFRGIFARCEKNLNELPSVQPEQRWDTCFSCPLSHGCPIIKGCSNDQAEQYAGEIPTDCPLEKKSVQPERKKGTWINSQSYEFIGDPLAFRQCSECVFSAMGVFPYKFCGNCGAEMTEGDTND